jgi:hypothetical protein
MFARALRWYQENLIEFWTVFLTIVLAGALRVYWLPTATAWNGDNARDMIIARHIVEYGEQLKLGHGAYGLRIDSDKHGKDPYGMSHYPSYFLRGMAVIWKVTGSELNLMIAAVLYQLVGMVILYLGLRQLFGWISAEFTLLLIAVSSITIVHSLGIAIHLALPWLFLIFTLFVTGIKQKKVPLIVCSALLCVVGTLLHYAFLLIFGWIVAATCIWLWRTDRRKTAAIFFGGTSITGAGLFLGLHHEVISFFGLQPFLKSFSNLYQSKAPAPIAQQQVIGLLMFRLTNLLFTWKSVITALGVGFVWMAGSLKKSGRIWLLGLACVAASILLSVGMKNSNTYHLEQVVFFDYVFLSLFGAGIGTVFTQVQRAGKVICLLFLAAVLYAASGNAYQRPFFMYTLPIQAAQAQAEQLIEQSPYPLEETEFYVSSYYSWDYESPTVIYWLEVLSGKKLVKLIESYNNLEWDGATKKHMIVSCQRYPLKPGDDKASCDFFVKHYESTGKYTFEKELFSNEYYRAFLYSVR